MYKYLLLLFMISDARASDIHPSLKNYVNKFERELGVTVDFPVRLAKVRNPQWVGVCITTKDGHKTVHIDPDRTNGLNKTQMEILVYHELGHCALDLDHYNKMKGKYPVSIMYSNIFSKKQARFWKVHRRFYIEQLRKMWRKK